MFAYLRYEVLSGTLLDCIVMIDCSTTFICMQQEGSNPRGGAAALLGLVCRVRLDSMWRGQCPSQGASVQDPSVLLH